ncbi:MAG TPA: hypothetical protein VGZ22_04465 [Isosphaeraceae bacterium]|jgi:hypothetical protein|nr:hypothetical protein [Isosphaeraceae bacterium]
MCTIRIGGERAEFLTVTLVGRSYPASNDYWDGNWIRAVVKVTAGGFRGEVGGDLRAEELLEFYQQLVPLFETLSGEATFSTMEGWLSIRVSGDGHGHMNLRCEVRDQAVDGNTLTFRLGLDQTFLRPMLSELGRAVSEFPVIGGQPSPRDPQEY